MQSEIRLWEIQDQLWSDLARSHDFNTVLALCCDAAIRLAGGDCGGIYLFTPEGDLELVHHQGLGEEFVTRSSSYPPDSTNAEMVHSGRSLYIHSGDLLLELNKRTREGLKALAIVPARCDGRPVGCLNIASHDIELFPEDVKQGIEVLSAQIGLAIDRASALQTLSEREENLRTFFGTVEDMLFVLDPGGTIQHCNHMVFTKLGYAREELVGRSVLGLHPPAQREEAGRVIGEMVEGKRDHCLIPLQTKSGDLIPVETKVVQGRWDGKAALFGVSRDVSERMKAERERRALERKMIQTQKLDSLGVLAGGMAHDFNNLLLQMSGFADLARSSLDDAGQAALYLDKIESTVSRAAGLTGKLLAYAGKAPGSIETLDLAGLIKEIKDLIRISLPPGVSLDLDVEAGPLPVKADPSQIRQVVMNLVINAYEALGGGPGSIVLKAGTDEGSPSLNRFFVEIRDTGCGMDEEVLTRVFEPFFTTKFTGRGLGLSAALGIIRESGGDISITTEPGRGTLVRFVLPGLEGADRRPEGGMHREGGGSVLVIDDEDAVREVTVCMLNRLGYRTIEACDGAEALELYRTRGETIDLVLLDLTMPAMDGAVTLDGLRRLDPAVPVIVVSGVTAAASQEILNRPQTVGYLTKPFTLDELKTAVSRIVQPSA